MSSDSSIQINRDYEQTHPEHDARFFARMGWLLTVVGAGGFFLWASLAPLDQGIPVQGTVVVSGKRKA
ncbi:hemolysin D, partial [Pseudomonas sp. K5002]|nr:hemolysin D [Pseudomonas sp. K5002]